MSSISIHQPISNVDIQNKINCKFILYSDMHKIHNIDELLPKTVILYELAKVGHFCCIFENYELGVKTINFFDPLGLCVDDELNLTSYDRRQRLNHNFTYLTRLLANQDKPVVYNEHNLQSKKTATCGHWVTIRLICSELPNDIFYNCFKNIIDRDKLIVKMYNSI